MHDIIFLWAHPRSVSSAMERAMMERGDMHTIHEPFLYLYYIEEQRKELLHFDRDPGHPTTYDGIKTMILNAARDTPVFVKDMPYYAGEHLLRDSEFIERVTSTFLIRNPARSIPSYYRLDPDLTLEEIGIEAQYHLFERVQELGGEIPVVIDAEDLVADTEATLRVYCDAIGVEFMPQSLTWDGALPEAWAPMAGWHTEVAGSRGTSAEAEQEPGKPDLDSALHLQAFYEHHLPFYQTLRGFRLHRDA